MLIKPNKSVLKIKDEFEKIKEQIVSNLDERYERLVNKEVYEENLNALNNLKKPYDKSYKKYDELERQRNNYLYGLLVSVVGLFFLYDLMTGQKIISDFDTFWYWVLAIFLTISGVAGMPLIYKQNQTLTSEAYDNI